MEPDERPNVDQRLLKQAASAFFFREVALGIFHQLGNEVNIIGSELLLMESLTQSLPELQRRVSQIHEHVRRAKNALDIVHQHGVRLDPRAKECYLATDIVRAALQQYSERAKAVGIVSRHSFGSCDFVVRVDREFFLQAILALFDNAFWAVKNNRTSRREVFVTIRSDVGKIAKIEISDTGVGVNPELTKRIFEPFFTTRETGTGLGLYFARMIIENSGGTLQLERSIVGKGTTFAIALPFIDTVKYDGDLPRRPR